MNLNLGDAIGIFVKTLPFVLARAAIYSVFGAAALVYCLVVFGFAALFAKVGGTVGGWMAIIVIALGIGGGWGLVALARSWLLHVVKAAHVAVATAYLTNQTLPAGQTQYSIGKALVVERFLDVNLLFVLDGLVRGSTRAANRLIDDLARWIPIPGIESLAQWVERVVSMAMNFIDETVLSYSIYKKDANVWQSAAEGVVLYAQSYREVLATAVAMALLAWASFALLVVAFGIVFWPISYSLGAKHGTLQAVVFLLPFVLGYVAKLSVVNPFAMIAVLVTFHRHAVGQPISQEWRGRIEQASSAFRELETRAREYVAAPVPVPPKA